MGLWWGEGGVRERARAEFEKVQQEGRPLRKKIIYLVSYWPLVIIFWK